MKALLRALAFLIVGSSSVVGHSQSPPAACTSHMLHVSRSTTVWVTNSVYLRIFGTIDGKHVELESSSKVATFGHPTVYEPGDYPVRLLSEKKEDGGVRRLYEVEVANGKKMTFDLVGMSE